MHRLVHLLADFPVENFPGTDPQEPPFRIQHGPTGISMIHPSIGLDDKASFPPQQRGNRTGGYPALPLRVSDDAHSPVHEKTFFRCDGDGQERCEGRQQCQITAGIGSCHPGRAGFPLRHFPDPDFPATFHDVVIGNDLVWADHHPRTLADAARFWIQGFHQDDRSAALFETGKSHSGSGHQDQAEEELKHGFDRRF